VIYAHGDIGEYIALVFQNNRQAKLAIHCWKQKRLKKFDLGFKIFKGFNDSTKAGSIEIH